MRWMHWAFALALFTASFDVFLVISAGGTIRFGQVMLAVVIVGGVAMAIQSRRILWPKGGWALLLWFVLLSCFVPLGNAGQIGLVLHLDLAFTIAGVYAVLQLYGRSAYLESLMKAYLSSYVFVACFGLFQLAAPPLHLGEWLVRQWIIHGKFARINGFSYEPSYFATYMIMGWITLLDLRYSKARITAAPRWRWLTILVGAVLFLSTSKIAWFLLLLEGSIRFAGVASGWLREHGSRLRRGSLRIALPRFRFLAGIAGFVVCAGLAVTALGSIVKLDFLLSGTGIDHTASHSRDDRLRWMNDTLAVIAEQPLLGRGFGGVAARNAERHGSALNSVDALRLYWGFPVILDVLAASGVLGFIPFLWFFFTNTVGEFALIRKHWPAEYAKWMRALIRGLFYEFLILLVDQNLLRMYLWFQVTMVVVVGFRLRYGTAKELRQPSALDQLALS